jgi:hypothetical protein
VHVFRGTAVRKFGKQHFLYGNVEISVHSAIVQLVDDGVSSVIVNNTELGEFSPSSSIFTIINTVGIVLTLSRLLRHGLCITLAFSRLVHCSLLLETEKQHGTNCQRHGNGEGLAF